MKLEEIGFYTLSNDKAKNVSNISPMQRCEMLVTGACNFSCPYCRGFENINSPEPAGEINLNIAQEALGYWIEDGLKNIRFSGGEPTLYDELPKLVGQCKEGGVERIAVSSNGSRPFDMYDILMDEGVNDFSISLDACCASFGDKMAGVKGKWDIVAENIKRISERTYVTVGVVLTEDNVGEMVDIVKYAHDLGVADIRIISAAQFNELLLESIKIPHDILDAHPILKYRVEHIKDGINVRGIRENDCHRCHLVKDDSVIVGNENKAWHFPCVIAMREGCEPIGEVGPKMREDRMEWFDTHNSHKSPICRENCLDVCVDYNNRCEEFVSASKEMVYLDEILS